VLPYWAEALIYGTVGVVVYLILLRRLRRRHWSKAPDVVLKTRKSTREGGRPR